MSILSDITIRDLAKNHRMIEPFVEGQRRDGCISYGLSSYGYDARVSDEFKIFTNIDSVIVDPKDFSANTFVDRKTDCCIIPPNSFALARTVEYFRIPRDVLTICLGKSTYARCGIIVNVTPLEPEWEGHVTLEFSNTTPLPAKIYANEGACQFLFFRGDRPCDVSYADRNVNIKANWRCGATSVNNITLAGNKPRQNILIPALKEATALSSVQTLVYTASIPCALLLIFMTTPIIGIACFAMFTVLYMIIVALATLYEMGAIQLNDQTRANERLAEVTETAESKMRTLLLNGCYEDTSDTDWAKIDYEIQYITDLKRSPHDAPIFDTLALKVSDLYEAWTDALMVLGVMEPDVAAATRREAYVAAKAIIADARQTQQRQIDEHNRAMKERAPDVIRTFSERARAIAGNTQTPALLPPPSTATTIKRLMSVGEEALKANPDMVDGGGARIDDLVRKHLPRLAQRHADAIADASIENLAAIDHELDEGVQEARASLEEALASDTGRRFDALREEVAFLKARRAG